MDACEKSGFFTLVNHGISVEEIEAQFAMSRKYFALPQEVKAQTPHQVDTNNGWEYKASSDLMAPFITLRIRLSHGVARFLSG